MQKKTKRLAAVGAALAAGALAVGVSLPALAADTDKSNGPEEKVVGGEPAEEGEFPFMMRLTIGGQDACGASLIRPDVALTAAHCTDGSEGFTVKYGTNKLDDPEIKEIKVTEVTQNPDFGKPIEMAGDWSVLKLEAPAEGVEPVKLAEDDSVDLEEQTIMGWGATSEGGEQSNELLKAKVPGVDDEKCKEAYGESLDPDSMLCAGLDEGGIDTCQGDSGGPMGVVAEDGTFTQTGIVSWGEGCAQPKKFGVYAQVSTLAADINAAADAFGGGEEG
ncbi:serine protease [Stackebrandtia nassauensis]|uniref:Peptidase S1 and S6 chymotrypsin/Hap n=1 Tax=Stackebrandtia nassauensis (strain DSM 44728 / CIP 108903 / NRRL B-16338 / NBRC 102104 / LLR-40K-21) TaxID=446470 RepID=D3PW08_STANL|nr:serine protease [Stackebrandtia nassauensis]ADD45129.1 peptidase S1 and S6 chymotrypsin/Hap [Stackebrandtia nassauensis DSM 44728]